MSMKKVIVKGTTIRIPTGYIPFIGRYVSGKLLESSLPIPVIIVDAEDEKEYECELVEVVPILRFIPSVFSRLVADMEPMELEQQLLKELNLESINQNLAFYLYRHGKSVC